VQNLSSAFAQRECNCNKNDENLDKGFLFAILSQNCLETSVQRKIFCCPKRFITRFVDRGKTL